MKELDIAKTLDELTIPEKIALLAGDDYWHTVPVPRLGIPRARFSDGPNGVRGIKVFNGTPAACFPCATALAASWDTELQYQVAQAIGDDCRAKGVHVLLGPTINTQRSPLGGRGFEAFSEDPYLSGQMASHFVNGLQSRGVAATVKHFVCNDQEHERMSTNVLVSERALHEIYLRPFEICLRDANPWALMTGYNAVNGSFNSENAELIRGVLRDRWQYRGVLISDYFGVYSTAEAIKAGLNLEMPGSTVMRGGAALRALANKRVTIADIDESASKVLELVNRAIRSGVPFGVEPEKIDTPAMRRIMRQAAAESIVLLKNQKQLLPLRPMGKIAVIGPSARTHVISGGGSASLHPTHAVTILQGIVDAVGSEVEVTYAQGCSNTRFLPLLHPDLRPTPTSSSNGLLLEFFNEDPWASSASAAPVYTVTCDTARIILIDNIPEELNARCWIRASGVLNPKVSGTFALSLIVAAGQGDLYVNSNKVIDNSTRQVAGEEFARAGTREERGSIEVEAGNAYHLELRFTNEKPVPKTTVPMGRGAMRIGGCLLQSDDEAIAEAVEVAKASDQVVLAVGLNDDWEAEGFDRADMKLPLRTDELVARVCDAQPSTVVVVQSGMPVEMPWESKTRGLIQAWYGGNEFGNGIADVIFGKTNPCGRLPLSYPYKLEHNPTYHNWGDEAGESRYGEGLFVGYRHYDAVDRDVMFPFGHGLSYSSTKLASVSLEAHVEAVLADPADPLRTMGQLNLEIENISSIAGKEVIQVYISPRGARLRRPVRELKSFRKVALAPRETQSISIPISLESFACWDPAASKWVAEEGNYVIEVGLSSRNIQGEASYTLAQTQSWR